MMDRKLFEQEVSAWLKGKDTLKQINWDIQDISSEERLSTVMISGRLTINMGIARYNITGSIEAEDTENSIKSAVETINDNLQRLIDCCEKKAYNLDD